MREGSNNANIEPVTYNETIQILDGRTKKSDDISGNDLEALKTEDDGKMITNKADAMKKTHQQTVVATKGSFHGTLRVDDKEEEAVRVFLTNVNGMSFWQSKNYKAERLKCEKADLLLGSVR